MISSAILSRFNKKYTINSSNGCWEWNGWLFRGNYGGFDIRDKKVYAHRTSYELFIGEIPKGKDICHVCDNPKCCNPFHLFAGTEKENMNDAQAKGRMPSSPHPSVNYYKNHNCRCDDCKYLYSVFIKENKEHRDEIKRRSALRKKGLLT